MERVTISKILSVTYEDVYDISMPIHHNFILENGVIAHNCAHSASYGVVANNGIYLKYKHPLYYYLGELTVHAQDRDDLKPLLLECKDLVLPPEVGRSHFSDWIIEGNKLRAPLTTVKGIGTKVGESVYRIFEEGDNLQFAVKHPKEVKAKKDETARPKAPKKSTKVGIGLCLGVSNSTPSKNNNGSGGIVDIFGDAIADIDSGTAI